LLFLFEWLLLDVVVVVVFVAVAGEKGLLQFQFQYFMLAF
jgi:hypothetical protein